MDLSNMLCLENDVGGGHPDTVVVVGRPATGDDGLVVVGENREFGFEAGAILGSSSVVHEFVTVSSSESSSLSGEMDIDSDDSDSGMECVDQINGVVIHPREVAQLYVHRDDNFVTDLNVFKDVTLAGDLGQLSPVHPYSIVTPKEELVNNCQYQGRVLWESFGVCQLTVQNRGQGNPEWFNAIRRLRQMDHTEEDITLFNTRYVKFNDRPPWAINATYIAYTNENVNNANEQCIQALKNQIIQIKSRHQIDITRGKDDLLDSQVVDELSAQANIPNRHCDKEVPSVIKLAIGCPVMLTFNLEKAADCVTEQKEEFMT